MSREKFEEQKYTYDDIVEAVKYGVNYGLEDEEELKIPEGNIQQWLEATKKRTAEEWQQLFPDIQVLDPDGWDRSNYKKTWYEEEITFQEYQKRRAYSTCMFKEIDNERV